VSNREHELRDRLTWVALILLIATVFVACRSGNSDDDATASIEIEPPGITVQNAWIRPAILPEGHPTPDVDHHHESTGVISAMYLVIENGAAQPVQLIAIETDIARVVELHETQNQNGLFRMRPVESVEVPARGEVVFEPGGLHVMLIDIQDELEPGDTVAVTLVFNTGERLDIPDVPVQE
jgi:periplasmic copper chaperone A